MKYVHIRMTFYQSIRIGFGLAIGFFAFKMFSTMLLKFIFLFLVTPSIPL
jgi:hypothetical protein